MNYTIENKKSKKNGTRKNNHRVAESISLKEKNYEIPEKRLRDGGFIAWPETKILSKEETQDIEIIEGRSKREVLLHSQNLNNKHKGVYK
ncbi:MAG TPA: hypothetical protein VGP55_14595 [Chitinophagaceae bacterium]|nr:hypothetical protein [Chitinophagaceae bacterium]